MPSSMSWSDVTVRVMPSLEEDPLLERLRSGEPEAVGEVYDQNAPAIRRFAQRLVGDASLAEDLVHEVFVSLPKAIKKFRGDSSLRTFLIAIAANHARHHVRSAVRRRAAMERLGREPEATSTDPEQDMKRKQLADILNHALDQLSLDQRLAFVLCEVEQRTSREAAEIVGVPEGTVRTRLFHAKQKLRQLLEAYELGGQHGG